MKHFFFLLFLALSPALSGQTPAERAASPTPPGIKDSYEFRRFLVGSTWTWCWKPDGSNGSEIVFTADGKVKHNAFEAKYFIRSRSDVELQWNGKTAKLHFDPATYARYTGSDFGDTHTLYGAPRPAGTKASVEEVTAAAFANPTESAPAVVAGPTGPTARTTGGQTYFGNRSADAPAPMLGRKDPGIERDLNVLASQHSAAVAPLNKRFQTDLAPLLKRAEEAGDSALALRIKNLMTSFDEGARRSDAGP